MNNNKNNKEVVKYWIETCRIWNMDMIKRIPYQDPESTKFVMTARKMEASMLKNGKGSMRLLDLGRNFLNPLI